MSVFAMIQAQGAGLGFLLPLIFLFAVLWVANDIPPFILVTSRTVFAMAFDRVMPERFGEISEKYHSPIWAIGFVSVVAVFGAMAEADLFGKSGIYLGDFFARWISPSVVLSGTDLWTAFYAIFVALAAVYFPRRKPEIFERSPWRQSARTVQVVGVLATLGQAWSFWLVLNDAHSLDFTATLSNVLAGKADFNAIWNILFTILLGAAGYGIYWYYTNKSKVTGVQHQTIFAEIPPE